MDAAAIAKVAFTSEDRVHDVIRNFNADGFGSLYPKCRGGHPPKFTLPQRRETKKIAKSKPVEHDLPFATWSPGGFGWPGAHHRPRGSEDALPGRIYRMRNVTTPMGPKCRRSCNSHL